MHPIAHRPLKATMWAAVVLASMGLTLAVEGRALLVGCPDLAVPDSLLQHPGSLVGAPAAFTALLAEVWGRLGS